MKPMAPTTPNYLELDVCDIAGETPLKVSTMLSKDPLPLVMPASTRAAIRRTSRGLIKLTVRSAIVAIACQSCHVQAQQTNAEPPSWRSRTEMQANAYERVAELYGQGRASLGRPMAGSESAPNSYNDRAGTPQTSSAVTGYQANYRDVPSSPWERAAPSSTQRSDASRYDANSVSNNGSRAPVGNDAYRPESKMIRQPLPANGSQQPSKSLVHTNRSSDTQYTSGGYDQTSDANRDRLPRGLPDRYQGGVDGTQNAPHSNRQNADAPYQGGPMTMDLSAYKKPNGTSFINQPSRGNGSAYPQANYQPEIALEGNRSAPRSLPRNSSGAQRLPYGGVAISTELDDSPVGLGYPEPVRASDETFDQSKVQMQMNGSRRSNNSSRESGPSEVLSVPASQPQSGSNSIPREAVRDVSAPSEALRKAAQINKRSQDREQSRVRYAQQQSLYQAAVRPSKNVALPNFESESTSRSNVIGVIPMETDYPFSTASSLSTASARVVPASVAINPQYYQQQAISQAPTPETLQAQSRVRTASRVSAELLDGSQTPLAQTPLPLEPPVGWNSIEDTLKAHISKCDDLLRRGAVLSAREEVLMGMRSLFRAIDLRSGTWTSEPAMDQAIAAFTEEADFYQSSASPGNRLSTDRIVSGHATRALKQTQLHQVAPDLAAQHYRSYAKQQWLEAAQGHPWTADLLYAYGKTLEREADQNPQEAQMRRSQAVICYQAALEIHPKNADNANQLGYALLQLDRVDEAHMALNHSIHVNPNPQAWNNLVEVYRRRGESDQVAFAQRNAQQMKQNVAPEMVGVPEVVEVDVKTFASVSPYPTGMQTPSQQPGAMQQPGQQPVQQASANVPANKPSWFGKLFR